MHPRVGVTREKGYGDALLVPCSFPRVPDRVVKHQSRKTRPSYDMIPFREIWEKSRKFQSHSGSLFWQILAKFFKQGVPRRFNLRTSTDHPVGYISPPPNSNLSNFFKRVSLLRTNWKFDVVIFLSEYCC